MTADTAQLSRRVVATGLVAATVGAVTADTAVANVQPPEAVRDWLHAPTQAAFQIPPDYLGLHSDHSARPLARAPKYPYDAVRSHDVNDDHSNPVTQWANIERKPGHYDWSAVDAWIAAHPGKTRIFVLFGCPTFYQKYPGEPWPYPYLPGGGSPPKDPRAAANFVSALLQRHPGMIQFVEVWNEPNFGWAGSDPLRDRWRQAAPGFFTGTASDLAAVARAVRSVLPASVKLLVGAWEGQDASPTQTNSLLRFAAAPDGSGGFGRDHVDALSVHVYTYKNDPNSVIPTLRNYLARFKQAGFPATMDRYVSEVGAEAPAFWTAQTPSLRDKVRTVKRWCMIPAALSYKGVYLYKHSLERTLGDPDRNPEIATAIVEMRNGLRGKRLTQAAVLQDASIWLAFSDATTLRA
jgi:hypothetical protein